MRVKATREGLLGRISRSGARVDNYTPAVALPCVGALWRWIRITNPRTHLTTLARVLDVGPWNEQDAAYVYGGQRPAAESGPDERGRFTNGAGIDLWERVIQAIGWVENEDVEWQFLDGPQAPAVGPSQVAD